MRIWLVVASLILASGCSVDTGPPARTAERFYAALAADRPDEACALLAPKTAEKLPDPGQTCGQALDELGLSGGGPAGAISLWGDEAQVKLGEDTLFLHRYSGGWKVKAAGCQPRGEQPYDCEVED